MVSDKVFDMALDNAKKLGKCLGAMIYLIRNGNLNNNEWEALARTWISVSDTSPWNEDDFVYIRKEAIRRGVDIG
jgi:hypothetical protein